MLLDAFCKVYSGSARHCYVAKQAQTKKCKGKERKGKKESKLNRKIKISSESYPTKGKLKVNQKVKANLTL